MILINSSPKDALKIFQPFLPISVPVGVACLLSAAEKNGIKAWHIDEQVEEDTLSLVSKYVELMYPPYIFGFSVLTPSFKRALFISQELKKRFPDSVIIFGGVHPSALPDEVLSYRHIDMVIRGEAEEPLIELYKCIKEKRNYFHIPNLSYRNNDEVIHNNRTFSVIDLGAYPAFPYHRFSSKKYDLGIILSSRGCPYDCIFCSNRITTAKKYRFKPAALIIDELQLLYNKYGRRSIQFMDDNFLVNKERTYLLIDSIKKRGLDKKMIFNFQARGDNVDEKLMRELFNCNFKSVFFGLETSNENLMKVIKKNETVQQCINAVRMAKNIGFYVSATFIYGLPGETHQDRMNCVKLSRDLQLDMVRYNNATPYPGTELYDIAKKHGRLNIVGCYDNFNSVSTFIENPFKRIRFSYIPVGDSEDAIRRDILYSYFSFYFDFGRLKKMFTRPDIGSAWFNAGASFGEILRKISALVLLVFFISVKFFQLFHYVVLKKETRISLKHFFTVLYGLPVDKPVDSTWKR